MDNVLNDLSHMRCAVLGAGGFIGTNLCRTLAGRVKYLRAFGRRQTFPEALHDCNWMSGDFADPTSISAAIDGCDVVFHLVNATTPATANIDKLADLSANVASSIRFLDLCKESSVKRVIFVSSGGTIYGIPNQVPTPENAPTDPITAYGISKLAIEKYLRLYQYLHGLDYRVLRVANPFGPFQTGMRNQGVIAAFIRHTLAGQPIDIWGDGSIIRDYIYIDDVVDALEKAAIHNGDNRIFNIGSGEGRSLHDLVGSISKQLGKEVLINHHADRLVDIPASILDIALAERDLGWKPKTDFTDGLKITLEWFKNQT